MTTLGRKCTSKFDLMNNSWMVSFKIPKLFLITTFGWLNYLLNKLSKRECGAPIMHHQPATLNAAPRTQMSQLADYKPLRGAAITWTDYTALRFNLISFCLLRPCNGSETCNSIQDWACFTVWCEGCRARCYDEGSGISVLSLLYSFRTRGEYRLEAQSYRQRDVLQEAISFRHVPEAHDFAASLALEWVLCP